MPIETRSNSALFRRAEQLKRWEDSETNKVCADVPTDKTSKIKFTDGCVFLAACAASDTEEVERLLEQDADINTANVDGLTALHQACIDDNLEMVQFLVEHGCDVNRGDNEGWTPLHATASCGFISIAKYLIENGANIAAVNNDGDLPIDIAESEEMEELLSDVLDEQGIDCDEARSEEERVMLEDAKQWLNSNKFQDKIHPRTGASALHVAAAKGYIKIMNLLIQAGADLNAQDNDGWTPLHAAAHWGQKEACAILADSLANMDIQNFAGQTCFDVAEPDLVKLLEELKKKQASMQKERPEIQAILQRTSNRPPLKRRTSVTRMSGQEKSKSVIKDTKSERAQIEQLCLPEEDGEEEKEKKTPIESSILISSRTENRRMEKEKETVPMQKKEVLETVTKEKPAAKGPEVERIPSWKKVLRRAAELSTTDIKSLVAEEPELLSKKPKTSEATEVKETNGPVDEENKDRKKNVEATPLSTSNPSKSPTEAASESNSTPSTPSTPSTTSSESQSQVKWPFIPPLRDEESELQRKAHAKRVRETRRSTQGVLLEDLKSAEIQFLIKSQQETIKRQEDKAKEMEVEDDDEEEEEEEEDEEEEEEEEGEGIKKDKSLSSSSPSPITTTVSTPGRNNLERRSYKSSTEEQTKTDDWKTSTNIPDSSIAVSSPKVNKSSQDTPSSPESTPSVTLPLRTKTNNNGDEQNQSDSRTALGTQAAIQRRRRPKRRSTGVVYLESDDSKEEKENGDRERDKDIKETVGISERARNKYGSSSSIPDTSSELSRSETPSRYSSISSSRDSLNEESDKDYKKLYEEMKKENDRLREKLQETEEELERTKRLLEKSTTQNNNKNSISETEKKERRALERKLSEMEEEVKQLEKLRADNERLRDENGALIRVISKLSK